MKRANLQVTRNLGLRARRFRRRLASNSFALAVPQFYTSSIQTPAGLPVEETHRKIGVQQFLVEGSSPVRQHFGQQAEALATILGRGARRTF